MKNDISHILAKWPYGDDEGLQVRRIEGRDGHPKLQLRIDLGLMQMETTGRPDGQRPHGYSSLLEFHRSQAQEHRREHGWYEGFELDPDECAALRQESLQFYHRRIAYMARQDYSEAAGDADHNLEILDLLKAFARNREDWLASEQYRAFILSHRIQCLTLQHLSREDVRAAILEVESGIRRIREVFAEQDRLDEFEDSNELGVLEELKRKLDARYEVGHRQRLQILLDDALRREDPDLAADLRSQLRNLESED
ncbi:MAG: UvrB/uvrC motif protein [Armatimonadetes bacterium]|nr:UvrB/uvrC motif protein [Armatimonadota bacterium]